jgi:hypothetical protein
VSAPVVHVEPAGIGDRLAVLANAVVQFSEPDPGCIRRLIKIECRGELAKRPVLALAVVAAVTSNPGSGILGSLAKA